MMQKDIKSIKIKNFVKAMQKKFCQQRYVGLCPTPSPQIMAFGKTAPP